MVVCNVHVCAKRRLRYWRSPKWRCLHYKQRIKLRSVISSTTSLPLHVYLLVQTSGCYYGKRQLGAVGALAPLHCVTNCRRHGDAARKYIPLNLNTSSRLIKRKHAPQRTCQYTMSQ